MITVSGLEFTHPAKRSGACGVADGAEPAAWAAGKQDSLSLSAGGRDNFHMELVSRLSREVRTMTSTGSVQALKQAVSTGEYRPDPAVIASRMLLMGD